LSKYDTNIIQFKITEDEKSISEIDRNILSNKDLHSKVSEYEKTKQQFNEIVVECSETSIADALETNQTTYNDLLQQLTQSKLMLSLLTSKEELDALLQEKINVRTNFIAFAKKLTSTSKTALTPEDIDKYSTYVSSVLQADLEHAVITDQIAGTIFIPLNLNLTIDGLSGMRQYQTFKISENILPKEYYNRIKFITTTIEHKVDIKNWETTINTIGVPSKPKAKYRETPFSLVNPSSNKAELLNALGFGNLTEQQLIDEAANNVIVADILGLTPQQLAGATNNS
jgi:hypothetical protein